VTRLAFFTPLHPKDAGAWADSFSGITDHNEELLWSVGGLVEIDVVIGPYTPAKSRASPDARRRAGDHRHASCV